VSDYQKKLDSPNAVALQKMTYGSRIKNILLTNSPSLKVNGYYACQYNILYDLQYCDVVGGLNQALPPDILHAILLGYVTRLLNGFAGLKKSNNDSMFVFSDAYKEEVERDLLAVGRALSKQSDMDMPRTHFPSGYMPNPQKNKDNSSGKKNAHELRGVLLTILCFILLHGQLHKLQSRIGDE